MTADSKAIQHRNRPFLLLFAEPIPDVAPNVMRYDSARQQSEMLVDGQWVDTVDMSVPDSGTRVTKVSSETTDDN